MCIFCGDDSKALSHWGWAGFENFASGIGGVVVVAYFSALCNLQFTASQYALISAAASIVGHMKQTPTAQSVAARNAVSGALPLVGPKAAFMPLPFARRQMCAGTFHEFP